MFAVFAVVAGLLLLGPGLTASASAADRGTIWKVGSDVTIPSGDTAEAIIAIGGNVTIAGTVKSTVVAVGGDVRLAPTAVIGSDAKSGDTSLVLVGGTLQRAAGSVQTGDTTRVTGSWTGDVWSRGIVDPIARPFRGLSLFTWFSGTLLYLLGAVLVAAIMPRMTTALRDRVRGRFWPTLGWGALSLIVIVPVVTVLLIVTIIGLLAVLPWLFIVIATLVLGGVAVAVVIGDRVLPWLRYRRENLILAAVVGVLVLRLVQLIPIAGSIVVAVAWIAGFGAAVMALWDWQRRRREHARELREVRVEDEQAA